MLLRTAQLNVFRNAGHQMEQFVRRGTTKTRTNHWMFGLDFHWNPFEAQPVQSQVVATLGFSPWYGLSAHPA